MSMHAWRVRRPGPIASGPLQRVRTAVPRPAASDLPADPELVAAMDEVRDGGFGMGSAAPIGDGAQPLGHSVQAYRDTMTFRTEDMPGYDSCEPDVWFYDAGAAERAGFSPAQGG